jgi:hypothetical protein
MAVGPRIGPSIASLTAETMFISRLVLYKVVVVESLSEFFSFHLSLSFYLYFVKGVGIAQSL